MPHKSDATPIEPRQITLFCSIGTHFGAVVRALKRQFPEANLTVVAPAPRTEPLGEKLPIDVTIEVTKDKLHPVRDLKECARLLRTMRAERCDLFVTMYNSTALNMLQWLSGSRYHAVFDARGALSFVDIGRFYPIRLIIGTAGKPVLGSLVYAFISTTIAVWSLFRRQERHLPVVTRGSPTNDLPRTKR
jgi:hypothetical protein